MRVRAIAKILFICEASSSFCDIVVENIPLSTTY